MNGSDSVCSEGLKPLVLVFNVVQDTSAVSPKEWLINWKA